MKAPAVPTTKPPLLGDRITAPIAIVINAGPDSATSTISSFGTDQHIITDAETTAFNIQDDSLKDAISAYFGQTPDDAYLHSPTPYGDLYQTYAYPQVQTSLSVQSATIRGFSSTPVTIATKSFQNTTNATASIDCGITQDVTASATSTWPGNLQLPTSVSYLINFVVPGGVGVSGENSLNYLETIGASGSESESITLGADSGCSVSLAPGETVQSVLMATQGQMTSQVTYQQTLNGVTAANYFEIYMEHHFWALDINQVMNAGGLPTSLTTVENTQINFYTDSKVVVNGPNGNLRATFPAKRTRLKALTARSRINIGGVAAQSPQKRFPKYAPQGRSPKI